MCEAPAAARGYAEPLGVVQRAAAGDPLKPVRKRAPLFPRANVHRAIARPSRQSKRPQYTTELVLRETDYFDGSNSHFDPERGCVVLEARTEIVAADVRRRTKTA